MGNVKEMPEGPMPQPEGPSGDEDDLAAEYVNDLVDKHSQEDVHVSTLELFWES